MRIRLGSLVLVTWMAGWLMKGGPAGAAEPAPFVPAWARGLVWYEIIPETFRNGDRANDVTAGYQERYFPDLPASWRVHPWTSDWYALSEDEKANGKGLAFNLPRRRYGGDLQGVIDRLDYLRDLGIGGVYLMPIFSSRSGHKYDALCYHHVDPNLGPDPAGDRALVEKETPDDPSTWVWTRADRLAIQLIEEAHRRDIRVIFDGPFDNLAVDSFAFADVRAHGERSRFKDWFTIYSYEDPQKKTTLSWKTFMGETIYAELRKDQPAPNQYILAATERWTRPVIEGVVHAGADGWRLDLADFIPHEFWKVWSARVRALNPQAFLMGECTKPFSQTASYVHAEGFSSVMNYGFKSLIEQFFVTRRLRPSRFDEQLAKLRAAFPAEATHALYNLLDSHDTERLASRIVNPDALKVGDARDFGNPEVSGSNPEFDTRKPTAAEYRLLQLVAIFQMTHPGAPALLAGDEVGMWGASRDFKPMVWEDLAYQDEVYAWDAAGSPDGSRKARSDTVQVNREVRDHFRKLIQLRRGHPALRSGDLETIVADDARELLVYARSAGGERIVVVINNGSNRQTVELESASGYRDLLSGERTVPARGGRVQVPVPAGWGAVLLEQ